MNKKIFSLVNNSFSIESNLILDRKVFFRAESSFQKKYDKDKEIEIEELKSLLDGALIPQVE